MSESPVPRVLLAEDAEDHARIVLAVLKKLGADVTWVKTGMDAYTAITGNDTPFALLLTDVVMPGMTGFELISRLSDEGRLPPTLVLTAKQDEADHLRGLKYGALDYLGKPFSPSVLGERIRLILQKRSGQ